MRRLFSYIFPFLFHYEVTQTFVWRHSFRWRRREAAASRTGEFGHYYEFGVLKGKSMVNFDKVRNISAIWDRSLRDIEIFCFDSFEGLPKASSGDLESDTFLVEGAYRGTLEEVQQAARKAKIEKIRYIKGFYEDSLTEELKKELSNKRPGLVHIDVDLYSSTATVLKWLDSLSLPGTIYFFDDTDFYYWRDDAGELLAIKEYNAEPSNKGILVEHPLSFGSQKVFVYSPRDLDELVAWRKNYDELGGT